MAIRGQALLVLYETPYTTGDKKLYARTMDINHPVVFMQTLHYSLFISTVMVSLCVRLVIQNYIMIICIAGSGHPALGGWYVKRHMQTHTGERKVNTMWLYSTNLRLCNSQVRPLCKLLVPIMPFKYMNCDMRLKLRVSIIPFNCTKCDNLIIYLPSIIYSDTRVNIHYINLTVWECRLSEILSTKCQ